MKNDLFKKLDHSIQCGDQVLVNNEWYPIIGFALLHSPNNKVTGDIFTDKPIGKLGSLGYSIDIDDVVDCKRPDKNEGSIEISEFNCGS